MEPITGGLYSNAFLSNCLMAISLYKQDRWGPCAVPSFWRKCFSLKMESLHFRHNSSASIIQRAGGNCSSLASRAFLQPEDQNHYQY